MEIAFQLESSPFSLFRDTPVSKPRSAMLRLQIDPVEGAVTEFNPKLQGPKVHPGNVNAEFRYGDLFNERPNGGYEPLTHVCMTGDARLFQRAEISEANWAVVDSLLEACKDEFSREYASEGVGPGLVDACLSRHGRRWRALDKS